jgi:hypothetical protein
MKEYHLPDWYTNFIIWPIFITTTIGAIWIGDGFRSFWVGVIAFFAIMFILLGLLEFGVESIVFWGKREKTKRDFDHAQQSYQVAIERQKKAHTRWAKMYYCYRDDVVFLPGEKGYVESEETMDLSYKNV